MSKSLPRLQAGESIWFDQEQYPKVNRDWFSPEYWQQQGRLTGQAKGRGTSFFIASEQGDLVLRRYLRGGLIGKLLSDQYFYDGMRRTRAWREWMLLLQMRELGLPVPQPVAARVRRSGVFYRAELITARIAGARDVHDILTKEAVSPVIWESIGEVIAKMHRYQVYHHDLNIRNIMLDHHEQVWIIDFDKCRLRMGDAWKADNLARLKRSLEKEAGLATTFFWTDTDWQCLLKGYHQG